MASNNEISRYSDFYISTVTFLVEDSLFKVPREPFQQESEVFCDMFSLPQADNTVVEGLSDENPIRIDGTRKDDFVQLLKALLHRKYDSHPNMPHGIEEWTSVLKRSTRWSFETLRQASIDGLMESGISAADRVVLAQQYHITNWLLPALNELARRPEPITMEEAKRMGIDIALRMASVRERVTVSVKTYSKSCRTVASSSGTTYPRNGNRIDDDDDNSNGVAVGSHRDPRMQNCDFSDQIRSTFSSFNL